MAHRVVEGTRSGLDRFRLREHLGRSERMHLGARLARYVGPRCAGCGVGPSSCAVVSAAGNVWYLCAECASRARS